MTTPRFRTLYKRLAPSWLTEGDGELVLTSLTLTLDAYAERLRQGVRARFPELAPEDALAALGRDRRIPRGVGELRDRYAARVIRAIDDWRTAGNAFALMGQLQGYLGPVKLRTVDARGNWYTMNADGTTSWVLNTGDWQWDAEPATKWSRFWVLIYDAFTTGAQYGDGTEYGDGTLWGVSGTIGQIQTIRGIVRRWKPAGTRCVNIIAVLDPALFDPADPAGSGVPSDQLWALPWKYVSGVAVPSRASGARYMAGTS
jgi:hypothetical protein